MEREGLSGDWDELLNVQHMDQSSLFCWFVSFRLQVTIELQEPVSLTFALRYLNFFTKVLATLSHGVLNCQRNAVHVGRYICVKCSLFAIRSAGLVLFLYTCTA